MPTFTTNIFKSKDDAVEYYQSDYSRSEVMAMIQQKKIEISAFAPKSYQGSSVKSAKLVENQTRWQVTI